jgi:hypothetical protein
MKSMQLKGIRMATLFKAFAIENNKYLCNETNPVNNTFSIFNAGNRFIKEHCLGPAL